MIITDKAKSTRFPQLAYGGESYDALVSKETCSMCYALIEDDTTILRHLVTGQAMCMACIESIAKIHA